MDPFNWIIHLIILFNEFLKLILCLKIIAKFIKLSIKSGFAVIKLTITVKNY